MAEHDYVMRELFAALIGASGGMTRAASGKDELKDHLICTATCKSEEEAKLAAERIRNILYHGTELDNFDGKLGEDRGVIKVGPIIFSGLFEIIVTDKVLNLVVPPNLEVNYGAAWEYVHLSYKRNEWVIPAQPDATSERRGLAHLQNGEGSFPAM